MSNSLTHVDGQGRPTMVDVSDKAVTARDATAESRVYLPDAVKAALVDGDIQTKKGPVIATAIIAGVMAAKKTHELIPFCHPLGLSACNIDIRIENDEAVIQCSCRVEHKTGVEMEALTGASVAALTFYDMCKALSQQMVIRETRVLAKHGGKSDFERND